MSFYLSEAILVLFFFGIDIAMFLKLKKLSFKGSIYVFLFWILVALGFFVMLKVNVGDLKAQEFLAGYILERTLSLDNIFVFYVIFNFFKIHEKSKERVLFWGIILAILLRILFIFVGAALVVKFAFLMYIFGGFLVLTGIKLLLSSEEGQGQDFNKNFIVKNFKRVFRATDKFDGDKFYIIENGRRVFTPLFIVMVLIAISDVIFALDSIPAIFGITLDPYIVIFANFFSLMGLRAIFCLISNIISYFYYIKYALSAILVFIGIKMMIMKFYHVPIFYSLLFIFGSIFIAIILSVLRKNIKDDAK